MLGELVEQRDTVSVRVGLPVVAVLAVVVRGRRKISDLLLDFDLADAADDPIILRCSAWVLLRLGLQGDFLTVFKGAAASPRSSQKNGGSAPCNGVETVGRPTRFGGHLEASGFLLDRIRRPARPRNRQTRKSLCQSRTRQAADPSRDQCWPYRHRGPRCHSRCQLNRHQRSYQAEFIQTVSLPVSTHALRAALRPSTHPGDPPQPRQRHHQQRRLL